MIGQRYLDRIVDQTHRCDIGNGVQYGKTRQSSVKKGHSVYNILGGERGTMYETRVANCAKVWYIGDYLRKRRGGNEDPTSISILDFKNGESKEIAFWCKKSKKELKTIDQNFDFVVRALGHDELSVGLSSRKPLDVLGRYLEKEFGWSYRPSFIKKKHKHPAFHLMRNIEEREEALNDNYYVVLDVRITKPTKILIIDDIITSSNTMIALSRELTRLSNKCAVYGFALCKTK